MICVLGKVHHLYGWKCNSLQNTELLTSNCDVEHFHKFKSTFTSCGVVIFYRGIFFLAAPFPAVYYLHIPISKWNYHAHIKLYCADNELISCIFFYSIYNTAFNFIHLNTSTDACSLFFIPWWTLGKIISTEDCSFSSILIQQFVEVFENVKNLWSLKIWNLKNFVCLQNLWFYKLHEQKARFGYKISCALTRCL